MVEVSKANTYSGPGVAPGRVTLRAEEAILDSRDRLPMLSRKASTCGRRGDVAIEVKVAAARADRYATAAAGSGDNCDRSTAVWHARCASSCGSSSILTEPAGVLASDGWAVVRVLGNEFWVRAQPWAAAGVSGHAWRTL